MTVAGCNFGQVSDGPGQTPTVLVGGPSLQLPYGILLQFGQGLLSCGGRERSCYRFHALQRPQRVPSPSMVVGLSALQSHSELSTSQALLPSRVQLTVS